jgi:hypothetical protein
MTDPFDQGRAQAYPVGSPPGQSALAYMSQDPDGYHDIQPSSVPRNGPMSAPLSNGNHVPERPNFPTRASTVSSPHGLDHKKPTSADHPHARSEDLNHGSSGSSNGVYASERSFSKQGFLSASGPSTPTGSNNHTPASSSDYLDANRRRPPSVASLGSVQSDSSSPDADAVTAATSTNHTNNNIGVASS